MEKLTNISRLPTGDGANKAEFLADGRSVFGTGRHAAAHAGLAPPGRAARADRHRPHPGTRAKQLQLATQNTELARLHQLELDEKIAAQLSEEKARLELLRYQLNPHFLLNAFTTLRGLVFSSPEAAGKTVERLADFCRLALTRSEETGASVDDEMRLIESYLDTEKVRWRDELHVEMHIDPAARPVSLPPFLLQPLVENAIKYGGRTSPSALHLA